EAKGHRAHDPEDDEMQPVVLQVRVELGAKEKRDKPHQRQRGSERRSGNNRPPASATLRRGQRATGRGVRLAGPRGVVLNQLRAAFNRARGTSRKAGAYTRG